MSIVMPKVKIRADYDINLETYSPNNFTNSILPVGPSHEQSVVCEESSAVFEDGSYNLRNGKMHNKHNLIVTHSPNSMNQSQKKHVAGTPDKNLNDFGKRIPTNELDGDYTIDSGKIFESPHKIRKNEYCGSLHGQIPYNSSLYQQSTKMLSKNADFLTRQLSLPKVNSRLYQTVSNDTDINFGVTTNHNQTNLQYDGEETSCFPILVESSMVDNRFTPLFDFTSLTPENPNAFIASSHNNQMESSRINMKKENVNEFQQPVNQPIASEYNNITNNHEHSPLNTQNCSNQHLLQNRNGCIYDTGNEQRYNETDNSNENNIDEDQDIYNNNIDDDNHNENGNNNNNNGGINNNDINDNANNNNGNDNNNNNNNNNNNSNNQDNDVPSVTVPQKKSSQAFVQKLQEIYKVIVKQEIELQERCAQLSKSQKTELKGLIFVYRVNYDLINNYVAFITTSLYQSQSSSDQIIGQEILDIYKIERRLWVYGTITFLDVLKNFSNFMGPDDVDPEICCQFITHAFLSISNMLADIPQKYAIPWYQKLGDLSRMAIALFPTGFIDWKLSAERWYMSAMEFTYGHGKLYYHISTVQQNTLEAFVNLGKSVFCQNTFVPSQQYLQLVIDNIYQRAYADKNNSNSKNGQLLVDYLKHSEVMLLPNFSESLELHDVVLKYFVENFGVDYNYENSQLFDPKQMFIQNSDQLKFFFRHAGAFAESHIFQLVGYGNSKTPFALLFELPLCLKEKKDKKEKKKPKDDTGTDDNSTSTLFSANMDDFISTENATVFNSPKDYFDNIDTFALPHSLPNTVEIWFESLKYSNFTAMKCSMIVLKKFLHGPFLVALSHLLPWVYFLLSLAYKIEQHSFKNQSVKIFWSDFIRRIFPWNSLVNFLNILIAYMIDNNNKSSPISELCNHYSSLTLNELIQYFNENEELPEVWKCRGSLWFDVIARYSTKTGADSYEDGGIKDYTILDFPIDGIEFDEQDEIGIKFWKRSCRVIFLLKKFSETFTWFTGLSVSYDAKISLQSLKNVSVDLPNFSFKYIDDKSFLISENNMEILEEIDYNNQDFMAAPTLSMDGGESFHNYVGYRRIHPDYYSFDKNGDYIPTSYYNSWSVKHDNGSSQSGSSIYTGAEISNSELDGQNKDNGLITEKELFNNAFNPKFRELLNSRSSDSPEDDFGQLENIFKSDKYFILDATSWLRHFAHVYKIATNSIINFAICLTTFQELRFLRKSKDENVVEAATRAIITLRQLYSEKKLLPVRFTGNVATHLEEHLEFEEQITWKSHVDEFVLEAVIKAEAKRKEKKTIGMKGIELILISDDNNMKTKARNRKVKAFSTRFVFGLANYIRSYDWEKRQLAIN